MNQFLAESVSLGTTEEVGFDVGITPSAIRSLSAGAVRAVPLPARVAVKWVWTGLRPGWRDGLELARVSKAFGHDVLLALVCREQGMVLITENQRDFTRIRRYIDFAFISPWPDHSSSLQHRTLEC